jgi:hypothetical protein
MLVWGNKGTSAKSIIVRKENEISTDLIDCDIIAPEGLPLHRNRVIGLYAVAWTFLSPE